MTADPRPTTTVTNDQGVTFHARLIRTGERYGLADKLTNDGAAMVEFFDAEADPAKFGPLGQFVSRYYVDTFNETAEDGRGIALEGSVPRWTITAANVAEVAAWLVSLNADDQRYEADPYAADEPDEEGEPDAGDLIDDMLDSVKLAMTSAGIDGEMVADVVATVASYAEQRYL